MGYDDRLVLIGAVREADEHFNVKAAPLVMPIIVIVLGIVVAELSGPENAALFVSLFAVVF
ncbi:hypothetical protein [Arthrobacter antioxidans]|uniref:hypothetical protein n=1 Tax=Arthrobacter antioxidans TaxID=2895818 RepID=UPI001FFF7F15|nr:hypothetical protein [Arthrobacter antioxidans]